MNHSREKTGKKPKSDKTQGSWGKPIFIDGQKWMYRFIKDAVTIKLPNGPIRKVTFDEMFNIKNNVWASRYVNRDNVTPTLVRTYIKRMIVVPGKENRIGIVKFYRGMGAILCNECRGLVLKNLPESLFRTAHLFRHVCVDCLVSELKE